MQRQELPRTPTSERLCWKEIFRKEDFSIEIICKRILCWKIFFIFFSVPHPPPLAVRDCTGKLRSRRNFIEICPFRFTTYMGQNLTDWGLEKPFSISTKDERGHDHSYQKLLISRYNNLLNILQLDQTYCKGNSQNQTYSARNYSFVCDYWIATQQHISQWWKANIRFGLIPQNLHSFSVCTQQATTLAYEIAHQVFIPGNYWLVYDSITKGSM